MENARRRLAAMEMTRMYKIVYLPLAEEDILGRRGLYRREAGRPKGRTGLAG